ncbi:hypothetical protein, partial [Xanthomonas graminis]|uniref:hypothetical protein n=1 Tax=Xanthomonas graminis TaxID=3390026 RepID=UPI001C400D98
CALAQLVDLASSMPAPPAIATQIRRLQRRQRSRPGAGRGRRRGQAARTSFFRDAGGQRRAVRLQQEAPRSRGFLLNVQVLSL